MKKFILILLLTNQTLANLPQRKIILFSPDSTPVDRTALIQVEKDIYQSFSDYYFEKHPKQKNVDLLLLDFETAQKYYLVKSMTLARQHYERVVNASDLDEWTNVQREIIFLAFVRLAEIDSHISVDQKEKWIRLALEFSAEVDYQKLPISKELLDSVAKQKNLLAKTQVVWDISSAKKDFRFVLMNGRRFDLKQIDLIQIQSGRFRVTYLSDVYKPQTYYLTAQQIPFVVPARIPFVDGNCKSPIFNNEGEFFESDFALYYSDECIKNQSDLIPTENLSRPLVQNPTHEGLTFYKSKWFQIGVTVLAIGLAATAVRKHSINEI